MTNRVQKIISDLPVEEVRAGERLVSNIKLRDVGAADIKDLLRSRSVRFVVADIGKPFEFIEDNEIYNFWKTEVRIHLAEPESTMFLEDFPNDYCYFASEWKSFDDKTIILLSKMH